ncbi:MAG: hypothetical protein Q7S20_08040 [Gemmatimonadaceae bacterium]|nr:hypothetical protein [Gemmatimonadaceae bacterium]
MRITTVAVALLLYLSPSLARAQSCRTSAVPRDPHPAGAESLVRIAGDFHLNEKQTKKITLEAGKAYWFAANGCPRMGNIQISILDSAGTVLKRSEKYDPALCLVAKTSGEYTLQVKASSLIGSNSWGSIDADFSASGCKN